MNFEDYRKAVVESRNELVAMKKAHREEVNSKKDTYTRKYLERMITEHDVQYLDLLQKKTEKLSTMLKAVKAKADANFEKYLTESPSTDILNSLTLLKQRDKVSKFEIDAMRNKIGNNYQALAELAEIADKNGLIIDSLVKPEEIKDNIDKCFTVCNDMAKIIDMDADSLSYRDMEFINGEMGMIPSLIKRNDEFNCQFDVKETPKTTSNEPTAIELIDNAITDARANGDYFRSVKLNMLKKKKEKELIDNEEILVALKEEIDSITDTPFSEE